MKNFSSRRLIALCRKESYQIVRDPSSIIVAFIIPILLLFIFGYGINLDLSSLRIGIVSNDSSKSIHRYEDMLASSNFFRTKVSSSKGKLLRLVQTGDLRALFFIQSTFNTRSIDGRGERSLQIISDGSEPNTANYANSYLKQSWQIWKGQQAQEHGMHFAPSVRVEPRFWYNASTLSKDFLVPGSISVVMTIIGALLTSLVIAREWERGTMEALLSSPVTKIELLLSKIIPYYLLGIGSMFVCFMIAVFVMGVPFYGSFLMLFILTTLFLGSALGFGLFVSTVTRVQFYAAQIALISGFLPALMLSGFVFEISSMPAPIRAITYIVPARYFANALQILFLSDRASALLAQDAVFLIILSVIWLSLTVVKTKRTLY